LKTFLNGNFIAPPLSLEVCGGGDYLVEKGYYLSTGIIYNLKDLSLYKQVFEGSRIPK
jgi:hypothetical protein